MKLQLDYNTSELNLIRQFFTEDEWDAIDSALADYQDYGDKETELMNSVGNKMYKLLGQVLLLKILLKLIIQKRVFLIKVLKLHLQEIQI